MVSNDIKHHLATFFWLKSAMFLNDTNPVVLNHGQIDANMF